MAGAHDHLEIAHDHLENLPSMFINGSSCFYRKRSSILVNAGYWFSLVVGGLLLLFSSSLHSAHSFRSCHGEVSQNTTQNV